ncbi:glycosyltransferase family 9 protein [Candidatus Poribacteria bacterium]|mgnify:CR=1 FL=1|jgi:ADP-heptose:LPS heptosyltransferase|nr:glycosyltransferase family 9 protein [Candidatus Poribacteria bacterium]MBT5533650.1 glycosyltransferase family 9 protein [Candidatus Poribacteria bacterium]MBT5713532.1 glycosyltransferase family 9 protein [Candidatus Poribacteria bacterium]MBT7101452.1 glycosyltransferase family 9 protein [Candidatus Poribacteria bacterium]MBT7808938.1 glycosyltransferase family 9 protein [Candidatus Poribacteria bacterium]
MAREFVLVRMYRLGDLLMASALVRAWKAEEPTHVTWIVADECAQLLYGQPYVNRLIVVPMDYIARYKERTVWREDEEAFGFPVDEAKQAFPTLFAALPERADRVVNLQFNAAAAMLAGAIEAPERAGPYADAAGDRRVPDRWSQYYLASGTDVRYGITHWVDAFINIGEAPREDIRMEFFLRPERDFAASVRAQLGGAPYFVVQPGSFEEQKRWPDGYFAEAATRIAAATQAGIVLTGGRGDKIIGLRIHRTLTEAGVPSVNLIGATDFHQLGAVLQDAHSLLSNDTFTQHFASTLGVPNITVFQGSPSPWMTLGYREGNRAVGEADASAPSVDKVVGAVLGTHTDYLEARSVGGYQFPMPAGPEAETAEWQGRWVVGAGHLRALAPDVTVGNDLRPVFDQRLLDVIRAARAALTAGQEIDMSAVEVSLSEPNHPLMALFIMFFLENRFALGADVAARQLASLDWLEGALLRAGTAQ